MLVELFARGVIVQGTLLFLPLGEINLLQVFQIEKSANLRGLVALSNLSIGFKNIRLIL